MSSLRTCKSLIVSLRSLFSKRFLHICNCNKSCYPRLLPKPLSIPPLAANTKPTSRNLISQTNMITFTSLPIFVLYSLTSFPIPIHGNKTTQVARNHSTPPQLLCLDSGYCVPKTVSSPSLDLESHIRLGINSEASLVPQLGGAMLDKNVVFAVRISQ